MLNMDAISCIEFLIVALFWVALYDTEQLCLKIIVILTAHVTVAAHLSHCELPDESISQKKIWVQFRTERRRCKRTLRYSVNMPS